MSNVIDIQLPLDEVRVRSLKAGDVVSLSGIIYSARDAAHKRLVEMLDKDEALPFDVQGATIYYMGPSPAKPGEVIGAAGPTTSYRMDPYAPRLIEVGLRGMVGKGERGANVVEAMQKFGAVYFAATGGAGALIGRTIKAAEVVAFPELGPEAVRRLTIENLPVIVAQDASGGNLYKDGVEKWRDTD
ncbi:MAG: Fe-S-containing hydro-lyase [Calditrichaeota bacterium]|nr:Fe-S-containing hydro-lyase [Calditrichota bacterium]